MYLVSATGERGGMSMDPDWVPDMGQDAIEVAKDVLEICNTKFLFCGSKKRIEEVYEAMKRCAELSEKNATENRIHELRKTILLAVKEYESIMDEKADAMLAARKESRPC